WAADGGPQPLPPAGRGRADRGGGGRRTPRGPGEAARALLGVRGGSAALAGSAGGALWPAGSAGPGRGAGWPLEPSPVRAGAPGLGSCNGAPTATRGRGAVAAAWG